MECLEIYISCQGKQDTVSGLCGLAGWIGADYALENKRDTGEVITMEDVHEEITGIMEHNGIDDFKAKSSRRKYAFELPGIPKEGDYLKVLYSYTSMYRQL